MKVKTLKPHENGYGSEFSKAEGAGYDIPPATAAPLIRRGLVEEVTAEAPPVELADMTVADLDKIIADEGVEVASGVNKAAKVEAIIAARAAAGGDGG